jgi:hypothetical protein
MVKPKIRIISTGYECACNNHTGRGATLELAYWNWLRKVSYSVRNDHYKAFGRKRLCLSG